MEDLHSIQCKLLDYLIDRAAAPQGSDGTTDLIDSGILDSLMLMDLVLHIQMAFDIELQAMDVTPKNFRSVARLARLVHQRRQHSRPKAA